MWLVSEFDDFDEIEQWQGEEDSLEEFEIAMEEPVEQKSRLPYEWIALGVVGVLAVGSAIGLGYYLGSSDDDASVSESNQQAASQSEETPQNVSDSATSETSVSTNRVDPAAPSVYTVNEFNNGDSPAAIDNKLAESKVAKDGQAWIVVNQIDFEMKLTGQVTSAETKEALGKAAQQYFASSVVNEVTVNAELGEAPWIAKTPELLPYVPFSLADGTMGLGADGMYLDGDVGDQEGLERFNAAISATEIPVVENKVAVQNFERPLIEIAMKDRVLTIGGAMPSQRAIDKIEEGAKEVFGENVTVEMEIDPNRNATYPIAIMGNILSVFKPLENEEFALGLNNNNFYTEVDDGIAFEPASSELNETGSAFLTGFAVLLTPLEVKVNLQGHTDNVGDEEFNKTLGEQRAQKVADFLVSKGLPESKIGTIEGIGESDPIEPNDTAEGRAKNRRVSVRVR